jgi:hypothetical protein
MIGRIRINAFYPHTPGASTVDSIGYYVMIALLGAGSACGLTNRGKPKPALTTKKRNAAIVCLGIATGCMLLALAAALFAHNPPPH